MAGILHQLCREGALVSLPGDLLLANGLLASMKLCCACRPPQYSHAGVRFPARTSEAVLVRPPPPLPPTGLHLLHDVASKRLSRLCLMRFLI